MSFFIVCAEYHYAAHGHASAILRLTNAYGPIQGTSIIVASIASF